MLLGYERVSTDDQKLALQHDALQAAGCEKIFADKMSGAKADRPGLQEALEFARQKDTLVVWQLDHLGRSLKDLIDGDNVLIAAHGNSLRAIIKYIKDLSEEEIVKVELGTGIPIVYDIDARGQVTDKVILN